MRIGIVSDLHIGYHHGSRVTVVGRPDGTPAGVNVREQDFIDAAFAAVNNLLQRNVDLIVDGGDIAHVAAPKKRAIQALIDLIRMAGVNWYSADGNHTSLKGAGDIHLYDILQSEVGNFFGYTEAGVSRQGIALVPHSYDPEVTKRRIANVMAQDPIMLVGHWAASDIQFDAAQVPLEFLPNDIPVFLGHYHRHTEQESPLPNYIGSTERTAWDQWDYPTGATVYDTSTGSIEFILHKTRPFVDLIATPENYLDVMDEENLEDAIVRLTIHATGQEYGALNTTEAKRKAYGLGALAYHHRRAKDKNQTASVETYEDRSIDEAWQEHAKSKRVSSKIRDLGLEALNARTV